MSNSMDCIYIKYNAYPETEEEKAAASLAEEEADPNEKKSNTQPSDGKKPVTRPLLRFLDESPSELSQEERRLQSVLQILYDMNDDDPPLFKVFPNWRPEKRLIIDTTTLPAGIENCQASFSVYSNIIRFVEADTMMDLLNSIAHELKHAEQCSKEYYDIVTGENHLRRQQLRFTGEAETYPFAAYVQMLVLKRLGHTNLIAELEKTPDQMTDALVPILRKYLATHKDLDWDSLREIAMPALLPALFQSSYKDSYDKHPIKNNDSNLTHLPEHFRSSRAFESKMLKVLKKIPHKARTPRTRFYQLVLNNQSKKAIRFFTDFTHPHKSFVKRMVGHLFGEKDTPTDEKPSDILNYVLEEFPSLAVDFWPPIHSEEDLTRLEQTFQKQLKILAQCPNNWPSEELYWKIVASIYIGMPNLMKDLLDLRNANGVRVLDNDQIKQLFLCYNPFQACLTPLQMADFFPKDMSPEHRVLSFYHLAEVAENFLDLKDEKGNYLATREDLNRPDSHGVLKKYKEKHPNDPRFSDTTPPIKASSDKHEPIKPTKPLASLLILQNMGASLKKAAEPERPHRRKDKRHKLSKQITPKHKGRAPSV